MHMDSGDEPRHWSRIVGKTESALEWVSTVKPSSRVVAMVTSSEIFVTTLSHAVIDDDVFAIVQTASAMSPMTETFVLKTSVGL